MERFLIVCAGSAVGGGARYLVSMWAGERFGTAFPYGTLIVNLVGCFVITLVMHVAAATQMSMQLRLLLTTGFLGGLTTYSSFDFETTMLFRNDTPGLASLNLALTVGGCFAAGLLGLVVGRLFVGE